MSICNVPPFIESGPVDRIPVVFGSAQQPPPASPARTVALLNVAVEPIVPAPLTMLVAVNVAVVIDPAMFKNELELNVPLNVAVPIRSNKSPVVTTPPDPISEPEKVVM